MMVFGEDHAVPFVDVHIVDLLDDMMSSNFPTTNSETVYVRYIRVSEKMIKHK